MSGADVVVIGGGIVGCSAAMFLAEAGVDVMLIDRGPVSGEASGVNAGMIDAPGEGGGSDLDVLLKMGSSQLFATMQHERSVDIGYRAEGQLVLAGTEQEWEWATSTPHGAGVELVDRDALRSVEPAVGPAAVGGLFTAGGGCAEPDLATRAFADAAAAAGCRIATGRAVSAIDPAPAGYRLTTSQGPISAATVVIAAGAWCAEVGHMLGLRIPVSPVRGQMWATAPLDPALGSTIAGLESAHHWAHAPATEPPHTTHPHGPRVTRHLYGRQRRTGEVIFGGDRVPTADRTVDGDGIASNHAHAAALLPFLVDHPPVRTWSGLMPFSDDGIPFIGPIRERPGVVIGAGLASSGFGRGPMTGRLAADTVLGLALPAAAAAAHPGGRITELAI